jgi:hypothetical protein
MAKIDKDLYSKEQWKLIREQRRKEKEKEKIQEQVAPVSIDKNTKRYVLCLKHGDKYSSEYVNILKRMVNRHLTLDYEFVCLTDNSKGLDNDIRVINLPPGLTGWWCKPYMFSRDLPLDGTVLYMDLDVVIAGNLDKLFTWEEQHWCIIRDFTKVMRPKWDRYNSSVIRFRTGQLEHIWKNFAKNRDQIMRRHHGDQDWIYEADKTAKLWPDSWIQSWKWQVRKDRTFAPGGVKGNRKLKTIEKVRPSIECCITVFHGDPNPHNCEDPWVVENWK